MKIDTGKLNFAAGPVMMSEETKRLGADAVPYFRTADFSALMKENEAILCELLHAPERTRVVFLTGSGTAAMEAAVVNTLSEKDRALVINGGSFGKRFARLCEIHRIPHEELCPKPGRGLKKSDLEPYENAGFTALLVNRHETSTGVLYDMELLADFCSRNRCLFLVDAVSSFLADPFEMQDWNVSAALIGSQKALALPPGISCVALNEEAQRRVRQNSPDSMYFDLREYLECGERGQTPFTPAVGILIQMNARLNEIRRTGIAAQTEKIAKIAAYFRKGLEKLPVTVYSDSLSNAVTPVLVRETADAEEICRILEQEYRIWVCPNAGELKKKVFRVGHMGQLEEADCDRLLAALGQLAARGKL